jgi:hypothetical protein
MPERKSRKIPAALLARYGAGDLTIEALGKILHRHQYVILYELQRLGIDTRAAARRSLRTARRKGYKTPAAMYDKVVRLYAQGLSLRQVARETGLSAPGVRAILLRCGVRLRRRRGG